MHLYIIAQHLNLSGQGEDRLHKLGRGYAARGHDVTVFTASSGLGLDLGRKKIGLKQVDGQTVVAFNVPYGRKMSRWQKISAYLRFARLAGKQGLTLPRPDLIVVSIPPLTAVLPALKLSEHYGTPMVVEVRELWPDALVQRGSLRNRLLIREARKLEKRAYEKAVRIVAGTSEIAATIKEHVTGQDKVTVIPEQTGDKELVEMYEQVLKGLTEKSSNRDSELARVRV